MNLKRCLIEVVILTCKHVVKQILQQPSIERDIAEQEPVQNDAQSPPVCGLPVAFFENNFWGDVLRSSSYL